MTGPMGAVLRRPEAPSAPHCFPSNSAIMMGTHPVVFLISSQVAFISPFCIFCFDNSSLNAIEIQTLHGCS